MKPEISMRNAGTMAADLIVQSCESARDQIADAVGEVQSLATRITEDADSFVATLMEIGEEHARRIQQATERLSELIAVIEQQKRAVASLCIIPPSEAIQQQRLEHLSQ